MTKSTECVVTELTGKVKEQNFRKNRKIDYFADTKHYKGSFSFKMLQEIHPKIRFASISIEVAAQKKNSKAKERNIRKSSLFSYFFCTLRHQKTQRYCYHVQIFIPFFSRFPLLCLSSFEW